MGFQVEFKRMDEEQPRDGQQIVLFRCNDFYGVSYDMDFATARWEWDDEEGCSWPAEETDVDDYPLFEVNELDGEKARLILTLEVDGGAGQVLPSREDCAGLVWADWDGMGRVMFPAAFEEETI